MSELNFKLKGWHAVAAVIVLIVLMGVRLTSFHDGMSDAGLMRNLQTHLASDYMPGEAARLQAAMDSGSQEKLVEAAHAVTGSKPEIESVRISAPFLNFTFPEDVVVKVTYDLTQDGQPGGRRTLYFLYSYSAAGDLWIYQHQTYAMKYYLNFI